MVVMMIDKGVFSVTQNKLRNSSISCWADYSYYSVGGVDISFLNWCANHFY